MIAGSLPTRSSVWSELEGIRTADKEEVEDAIVASAEVLPGTPNATDSLNLLPSTTQHDYGSMDPRVEVKSPRGTVFSPNVTSTLYVPLSAAASSYPLNDGPGSAPIIGRKTSDLLVHSLISSIRDAHVPLSQPSQEDSAPGAHRHDEDGSPAPDAAAPVAEEDPNAQRVTPTWVTGWNVLNLIQGIGILGIPYAFANAGWVSIPIIVCVAALCCFTGRLLAETLYRYPERHCRNYFQSRSQLINRIRIHSTIPCVAEQVWPGRGRRLATVIVIAELFGATVLYMILLGQSASALLGPILTPNWPVGCWTCVMTYLCMPLLLYPRMRAVAWFSVVALIGLFAAVILVLVYCFLEIPRLPNIWSNLPAPTLAQLPVSLSIIVFSYCAHALFPGIEGSMKHPEEYNKMMNISFTVAALIKVAFGLLTALVFGKHVAQAVTDSMTSHYVLVVSVHVTVLINVFLSIPIIFFILGEQLDRAVISYVGAGAFGSRRFCSLYTVWFVSSRCAIINLGLVCGTMVPHFALVMSLIGAITGSLLCFVFPALFHLIRFRSHLSGFSVAVRVLICVFGVLMGTFGVIFSGMSIYQTMTAQN